MLTLQKVSCDETGAFYEMFDDNGEHLIYAAAHSYLQDDGSWAPKVTAGVYDLELGDHEIEIQKKLTKITTYEVKNVPGHTGILCPHVGNWPQTESDGCFLAGTQITVMAGKPAVKASNVALALFFTYMNGAKTGKLEIKD
jgi:hypothetical protein